MLLMCGVGVIAWSFELQPDLQVEPSALASLPSTADEWHGTAIPTEAAVERLLRADFNLQREYRIASASAPIWLYVGYYGTTRGGRPEHMPAQCYPAAGWWIEEKSTAEIDAARGLRAHEYIVSNEDEYRLVYFWLRSSRKTGMLSTLDTSFDRLRGRLTMGRGEGALVRVSTPVADEQDLEAARARLGAFAAQIDRQLDDHWPREIPNP